MFGFECCNPTRELHVVFFLGYIHTFGRDCFFLRERVNQAAGIALLRQRPTTQLGIEDLLTAGLNFSLD